MNDSRYGECNINTVFNYCDMEMFREQVQVRKLKHSDSESFNRAVHAANFFNNIPAKDRNRLHKEIFVDGSLKCVELSFIYN